MRTTAKPVIEALRTHVLEYFTKDYGWDTDDKLANLVEQIDAMQYGNRGTYRTALDWAEGGGGLIYYTETKEFLNSLGINPTGIEYTDDKSWKLYCHLVAREITKLYEGEKR